MHNKCYMIFQNLELLNRIENSDIVAPRIAEEVIDYEKVERKLQMDSVTFIGGNITWISFIHQKKTHKF